MKFGMGKEDGKHWKGIARAWAILKEKGETMTGAGY